MILALDIEATLVISAHWPWSRPGLRTFLEWSGEFFERVVVYTALDEPLFRQVADFIVSRKEAPAWFLTCPHYRAHDYPDDLWDPDSDEIMCKDLSKISGNINEVLIVDDYAGYILPHQKHRWIQILPFDGDPKDRELERVRRTIEDSLKFPHTY